METTTVIEQLTLSGVLSLLTYLQHVRQCQARLNPDTVAAMLWEMLNQLNIESSKTTVDYGWDRTEALPHSYLPIEGVNWYNIGECGDDEFVTAIPLRSPSTQHSALPIGIRKTRLS
jgi:hypothetical protein